MRNWEWARDYLSHFHWSGSCWSNQLPTPTQYCCRRVGTCSCRLLSGLLTHSSKLRLAMESIPLWRVINLCDRADAVFQQTQRLDDAHRAWLQRPCAPMPLSEDRQTQLSVHPRLVTSLTGFQSHFYYMGTHPSPIQRGSLLGFSTTFHRQCCSPVQATH